MDQWWIAALAVAAVGLLLVVIPKLLAVWLVGRGGGTAQGGRGSEDGGARKERAEKEGQ